MQAQCLLRLHTPAGRIFHFPGCRQPFGMIVSRCVAGIAAGSSAADARVDPEINCVALLRVRGYSICAIDNGAAPVRQRRMS